MIIFGKQLNIIKSRRFDIYSVICVSVLQYYIRNQNENKAGNHLSHL